MSKQNIRPTLMQEKAFKIMLRELQNDKPVYLKRILKEAGFAPSTCSRPALVTRTAGWEYLKAKYADDEMALQVLHEQMSPSNENEDNRQKAAVWTLKLNDRFPAHKSKAVVLFDKISNIFQDDKEEDKEK